MITLKMGLGLGVDQSVQTLTHDMSEISKKLQHTKNPIKFDIEFDRRGLTQSVDNAFKLLEQAFKQRGIQLSKTFTENDPFSDTAKITATAQKVKNLRDMAKDAVPSFAEIARLMRTVYTQAEHAGENVMQLPEDLKQLGTVGNKYWTKINKQNTQLVTNLQKYLGIGGSNEDLQKRIESAYEEIEFSRQRVFSLMEKAQGAKADPDAYYAKGKDSILDRRLSVISNINSELEREIRLQTALNKEGDMQSDKKRMSEIIRQKKEALELAKASLVGTGDEIFESFGQRLRSTSGVFTKLEKGVEDGSTSYEKLGESVSRADELLKELDETIAHSKNPYTILSPTSKPGQKGLLSIQKYIKQYRDLANEYNRTTSGTSLSSEKLKGISSEIEHLQAVRGALEGRQISSKDFVQELSNAIIKLGQYREEMDRLSDLKKSGSYTMTGTSKDVEDVARMSVKVQNELNKISTAGETMKSTFGADLESALSGLRAVSEDLEEGGVDANKFANAMETARSVLARLQDAQAQAAAPDEYIKRGTDAYNKTKDSIDNLISSLDTLEKKYLSLGNTTSDTFATNGGVSYVDVRTRTLGMLESLKDEKLTNEGAASGISAMREYIELLKQYEDELSKVEIVAKKKDQLEREALATQRRGTQALKWTAAKNDPNAAQYYEQVAQGVRKLSAAQREWEASDKGPAAFKKLSDAVSTYGKEIDSAKGKMEELGKDHGSVVSKLGEKFKTLFTYAIGARVIYGAASKVRELISQAVELDSAMGQLRIVTDETESAYRKFGNTAASTAKEIGASMTDIINATTTYARLGYSLDESSILSKYTAMLSQVGDIESSAAQDALTSMIKAFGDAVDASKSEDIEHLMDELVKVGKHIAQGCSNAA